MDQNFIDNIHKRILWDMGEAVTHLERSIKQLSTTSEHYFELNDTVRGIIRKDSATILLIELDKLKFINDHLTKQLKY